MILPIYTYGQPVLKQRAREVDLATENLKELVDNMWETMYHAKGVGLAAPQVGKSIRLFIVDSTQMEDEDFDHEGIKEVFVNAWKVEEQGDEVEYEEGCLSIPDIRGDVERPEVLHLEYCNLDGKRIKRKFEGLNARVIQHEYDHIEGVLFVEHLKPIKRRRIKRRLDQMRKGIVTADYAVRPVKR